jgi:protein TonB
MYRTFEYTGFSFFRRLMLPTILLFIFSIISLTTHAYERIEGKIYFSSDSIFPAGMDTTKPPPPLSMNDVLTNNEKIVFIDGKETKSQKIIESIMSREIDEIKILTPEEATLKYGKKGNKGAIEITTKIDDVSSLLHDPADTVHTIVETPASFPGGVMGWARYLEQNLDRDLTSRNRALPGRYTVIVSFIVNRDGSISDVKADNDPGYGTAEEAKRMFLKGTKWIPAFQGLSKVKSRQKQSITFVVADY